MGLIELLGVLVSVAAIISVGLWSTRDVKVTLGRRMDGMDRRFDRMDERFDRADARFEAAQIRIDDRFDKVDARFALMQSSMDARFDAIDRRFDGVDSRSEYRFDSSTMLIGELQHSDDRLRGEALTRSDERNNSSDQG